MSLLKEIKKSATVAWSPIASRANVIATGSKEGVGVDFDNHGGELELFELDFPNVSAKPTSIGRVAINARFQSMAWNSAPKYVTECPFGVIAGGMADGLVNLWNPAKIMAGKNTEALVGQIKRHTGPVNVVQFNPHHDSSHLLASGGSDSQVYISSLENLASPQVFSPGAATGPSHTAEVSCLSWNPQVSYILATGSVNGITMIWDLKSKKPWCELKDPNRGPISAVAWNPDEGLYIITASGDDQRPVLRMWDLRSSTSTPLAELTEHTAGILSLSWCPHDAGLLLSCAKDNRTLLWDLYQGNSIFEFPSEEKSAAATAPSGSGQFFSGAVTGQRRFDVQWSKMLKGVASTSTFDGKVQLWGLQGAGASKTQRAPVWYRRPASVSFGFGGKLVTVSNPKDSPKMVHIQRLVTEPKLVSNAEAFEMAVQSRNFDAYCQQKIEAADSSLDRDIWTFMHIIFQPDARQHILLYFGFDAEAIAVQVEAYTGHKHKVLTAPDDTVPQIASQDAKTRGLLPSNDSLLLSGNAADIFSTSATTAAVTAADDENLTTEVEYLSLDPKSPSSLLAKDMSSKIVGNPLPVYTEESEKLIRRSLLVGNFQGAVDCCLRNYQFAEALLISTCGGAELHAQTQAAYFAAPVVKRPFMSIMSAIINSELSTLVKGAALSDWKETLAILSTYAKSEEFPTLCDLLGTQLLEAGDSHGATLCFMCATNVSSTVELWVKESERDSASLGSTAALAKLVERVSIFAHVRPELSQALGASVGTQYSAYATLLATQGRCDIAARFATYNDPASAIMRDRLHHASSFQSSTTPPQFPFERYDVTAVVSPSTTLAADVSNSSYPQPSVQPTVPGTRTSGHSYAAAPARRGSYGKPQQQPSLPGAPATNPSSTMYSSSYPNGSLSGYASLTTAPVYGQQSSTSMSQYSPSPIQGHSAFPQASKSNNRVTNPSPADMHKHRSDGFVSSVGNTELTRKYGNTGTAIFSPNTSNAASFSSGSEGTSVAVGDGQKASSHMATQQPSQQQKPMGCTTSILPADQIIVTVFNELLVALEGARLVAAERRQLPEMVKAKDILFSKLNDAVLTSAVVSSLHAMVTCFQARDYHGAKGIHVALTTSDWSSQKDWLKGIKAVINTALKRLN